MATAVFEPVIRYRYDLQRSNPLSILEINISIDMSTFKIFSQSFVAIR